MSGLETQESKGVLKFFGSPGEFAGSQNDFPILVERTGLWLRVGSSSVAIRCRGDLDNAWAETTMVGVGFVASFMP